MSFLQQHRGKIVLTAWGLLIAGILRAEPAAGALSGSGHSICGPWGCGPPLSSLIVWHTFIAAVVVPASVWAAFRYPAFAAAAYRPVVAVVFGACLLFVVVNTALWWQTASEFGRQFLFQRMLFAVVAFTDAPVIPAAVAATAYGLLGRRTAARIRRGLLPDNDGRSRTQQMEDLSNVIVSEMDASS